jgi:adenosylmethionine-8-amino-7-oxononanoate aminotransferase
MASAKAVELVETREQEIDAPAPTNGQAGGVAAMEQSARDHVWIHMLPWAEFDSDNLRIFDRGDGARLYDVHGREYLDGIAGLWVVNAGHGRREIAQAYATRRLA